jgi:hypothetical protein
VKDVELVSGWVQEILLKEKILGHLDSIHLLLFYKINFNSNTPVDLTWISSITGLSKPRAKRHVVLLLQKGYLKNIHPSENFYVFRLGPVFREKLINNVESLFNYSYKGQEITDVKKTPEERFLEQLEE